MRFRGDTVKLGLQFRTVRVDPPPENWREIEEQSGERQDRIELSFSSEQPVERYWGWETLGHKKTEVVFDRLRDGGAFLKDHIRTQQIGVAERAWLDTDSRKGRAGVRFGKTALAEEERVEVLDRVRTKISVGYIVHELTLEKSDEFGDHYRATRWEPVEISTVAIPADVTVGIGRELSALPELQARAAEFANHETRLIGGDKGETDMRHILVMRKEDGVVLRIAESDFNAETYERVEMGGNDPPTPPVRSGSGDSAEEQLVAAREAARDAERVRIRDIRALGAKFNASDRADQAIDAGTTFAEFRMQIWESGLTPSGQSQAERTYPSIEDPGSWLGLSRKELERYSLLRAIQAAVTRNPSNASFEMACSDEVAKRTGRQPQGFFIPRDMMTFPIPHNNDPVVRQRIQQILIERTISSTTQGGASLIATDLLAGSFIDVLRNASVAMAMGATFLPGLVGDVDIPRQTASGACGWVGEAVGIGNNELALDVVSLTPHTLGNRQNITRKMLLQGTPAIEGLVRTDLAAACALGIDAAVINGSGTGAVPEGILNMTGLGVVPLGANGAAMTWAAQVALEAEVSTANALTGSLGFVTNPVAKAHMMTTPKETGYPVYILQEPGRSSLSYPVMISNQIPANLTKGTGTDLSAEIFGNWADELIGEWGVMDIFPDPYTLGDNAILVMRVFQDADCGARHEESFSAVVDMDTA